VVGLASLSLNRIHMANVAGGRLMRTPTMEMTAAVDNVMAMIGRPSPFSSGKGVEGRDLVGTIGYLS